MKDNQIKLAAVEAKMAEKPIRVLCVDSNEAQLDATEKALHKAGYETLCVTSGAELLTILGHHPNSADIILLDRELADMDGIEALKALKRLPELQRTPVIIQTSHPSPQQAAECIEAGVYYYLGKPYAAPELCTIVRAAAREFELSSKLQNRLEKHMAVFSLAQSGSFEIRTLKDARELAAHLAHFAPDPSRAVMALTALMINAIEHGNLNIGHDRKNRLLTEMCWQREVERLLELPENQQKTVRVTFERLNNGNLEIHIIDRGEGFDWNPYLDFDPSRMTEPGGRGIARARAMNCGVLRYAGHGNEAVFTIIPREQGVKAANG